MGEGAQDAPYASVLARLKAALDPNAILAPRRYEELRSTPAEIQNRSYAT
jgi:hypothetical protein